MAEDDKHDPWLVPPSSGATAEHHEVVVPVRDITRPGPAPDRSATSVPMGADTAFRVAFPFTYDIVLDQPEGTETAEDV